MSNYRIIYIVDFLNREIVFNCHAAASGAAGAAAAALDEHRADGCR